MPPLEEMDLHQPAVLWRLTGRDRYGEPTLAAPEEITVRWDETRREATGTDGSTIAIDVTVVSTENIPDNSLLWLGELADYEEGAEEERMQVVTRSKTPSIHARFTRYQYGLARFRDTLPDEDES
jgi:hypothetical protein